MQQAASGVGTVRPRDADAKPGAGRIDHAAAADVDADVVVVVGRPEEDQVAETQIPQGDALAAARLHGWRGGRDRCPHVCRRRGTTRSSQSRALKRRPTRRGCRAGDGRSHHKAPLALDAAQAALPLRQLLLGGRRGRPAAGCGEGVRRRSRGGAWRRESPRVTSRRRQGLREERGGTTRRVRSAPTQAKPPTRRDWCILLPPWRPGTLARSLGGRLDDATAAGRPARPSGAKGEGKARPAGLQPYGARRIGARHGETLPPTRQPIWSQLQEVKDLVDEVRRPDERLKDTVGSVPERRRGLDEVDKRPDKTESVDCAATGSGGVPRAVLGHAPSLSPCTVNRVIDST